MAHSTYQFTKKKQRNRKINSTLFLLHLVSLKANED